MRNFHRDFESLNEAYNQSVKAKTKTHETLHETPSSDIDNIYRSGSVKQLREALGKLCDAHTKDASSLTYEEVCNEIKSFAEEKLAPTIPAITTPPTSPMHNEPVTGLAQEQDDKDDEEEEVEEGTDGSTDDLTEREKFKLAADAAKKGKGPLKKESNSGNIHAALKDDEDAEHYEKTGEIRKKKKEDEGKKDKVGENFEKMLEILKLARCSKAMSRRSPQTSPRPPWAYSRRANPPPRRAPLQSSTVCVCVCVCVCACRRERAHCVCVCVCVCVCGRFD